MRRSAIVLLGALLAAGSAEAFETGRHQYEAEAPIRHVRAFDADADGRKDLVLLLEPGEAATDVLLVLRTPERPDARTFFPDGAATRVVLDGPLARAGAVALGRFGPEGEPRIRLIGPDGITDLDAAGRVLERSPGQRFDTPIGRSPGRRIAFWDGSGDLDGDGRDELWLPVDGEAPRIAVLRSGRAPAFLALRVGSRGTATAAHGAVRHAAVPRLEPADLDGDGRRELVTVQDERLVGFDPWAPPGDDGLVASSLRLRLAFLERPADLAPTAIRAPRLQLADVDADGSADLLVTVVTGTHDRPDSLRTTLVHYAGPFVGEDGALVRPRSRIDTPSVVLHPTFADADGDGRLDYLGDSIRGTLFDLVRRALGADAEITYEAFLYDPRTGGFASRPWFEVERDYPHEETVSNRFGPTAAFADFDGDGRVDLLDLGALEEVRLLRGVAAEDGRRMRFAPLVGPIPVPHGLDAAVLAEDLTGDGRAEGILRRGALLYVLSPRGPR